MRLETAGTKLDGRRFGEERGAILWLAIQFGHLGGRAEQLAAVREEMAGIVHVKKKKKRSISLLRINARA